MRDLLFNAHDLEVELACAVSEGYTSISKRSLVRLVQKIVPEDIRKDQDKLSEAYSQAHSLMSSRFREIPGKGYSLSN